MDELSHSYVRMVCGPQAQLDNPKAVVDFVDELKSIVEKSSQPRRNFLIDASTPHGDVMITESSAMKPSVGWVTLPVTEGIRQGVHEWCITIVNQGETTDGSGLMIGLIPKNFSKYDSFISQGGGWCISRAGKFYGHWKRRDSSTSTISFGTGDRVIFTFDYKAAMMTVRVGSKSVVGELNSLTGEVFPAASLHYRNQHIRYDYHIVHDAHVKKIDWLGKHVLPQAASFVPLTSSQLYALQLNHYVFSPVFQDDDDDTGASSTTADSKEFSFSSPKVFQARLDIVKGAIRAVRSNAKVLRSKDIGVRSSLTPAMLREQQSELQNSSSDQGASANCGAIILIHLLFDSLSRRTPVSGVLVEKVSEYLSSLGQFSFAELPRFGDTSNSSLLVSPKVAQLASDSLWEMLNQVDSSSAELDEFHSSLLTLHVLLSFQRGLISEVLRSCRVLLRFSNQPAPPLLVNWFREKGGDLEPSRRCHVLATHLHTMHKDESRMNSPAALTVSGGSTVLSFACGENCVYIHDAAGVKKFVQVNDTFALDKTTEFPINVCAKASKSSMVVCGGTLFLLTDLMESENVGVVSYTDSLETFKAFSLSEMHPAWPRHVDQLATLAAGDNATFGLVCHSGGTSPKWKSPMEVQIFHRSTFPKLHYRKSLSCLTSLARPQYGLRIGKGSTVELGSPDTALGNANGHCTIEIWVQILQTKEQTCFYAHGDDSTTGEVFIDGTLLDNSFYVRGGFRHETRGTSMVSAPFPLLEATGPVHIVLSFDGKWHLYFNGAEVGTSTAPHVSLIAPKQTWKVGGTSSFLICGLRVWRVSRSSRAIVRDAARVLNEEKENLLVQMFFSEESGNTVYNYVPGAKESGGICCGEFEQVYLSNHPFRSNTDDALRACLRSGTAAQFENLASLHSCCIMENTLVLGKASSQDRAFRHTFAFFSLYTGEEIPSQVNFVGGKEMVRVTRDGNGTLHMFSGKRFGDTLGISCVRAPGQAASVCGDINLPEESSVPLVKDSCGSLALDFLSLLTRHSADAVSNQAKRLFTPLSDDVSKECVDEIRVILNEQVRTIKTHNARRTVTLSKEYSYLVISSVIHILLRLILRVKEFQLCSTAVGLNVKGEDGSVMGEPLLKELYSPQQRRGSRAGEESSESVIHILTDILNEGGFSFDEGLTLLAEAALREGIELFIPDVRVRASLLRDTMRSTNISSRPKSLSVLMDSITESFTHISSSTMLLCGGSENSPEYRRDLLSMLQLLLQESVDILKKRSGEGASDDMYGLKRLATLTQSIEVLQLLLISGEEESDEEPNSRSELSTCGKHDASSEYLKLLFRVTAQGLEVNLKPDASKAFLFSAVYQFLVSIPVITTIDTSLGIADELDGLIKVLGKWIEDHPADEFREMRSRICTAMDAAKFSVCWVSAFMSTYSAVIVPSGQERWTAQRTVDHPVFLSGFVLDEPIQNYSPRRKFLTNFVDKKRDALVQPGPASTGAVPTVLDEVILRLAMASIYLSNISRLHAFPESKLQLLVVSTVKLFSPFRNKMFSQYGMNLEAYTSLNEKSRLVDHLISSYDVPVFYTVPGECGERGKHVDPLTPQDRWKWAFLRVRRALNLRRTHLVTSGSFDISSLVSFFSCVMSEEGLLREEVVEEVRKRRTLADIRAYGYQKRLTICQSNSASAGVVMSLSKKLGGQEPQHYAAGLCGSDVAVQFAIRQSVYSAVHLLLEKSGTENPTTGDPVLPLVDSLWAPADFPVLEKDGFHRQLFRRYCSLFSPDYSKMKEEDSTAILHRKDADSFAATYMKSVYKEHTDSSTALNEHKQNNPDRKVLSKAEKHYKQTLDMLKHMGLQVVKGLTTSPSVAETHYYSWFLQDFFSLFDEEICACSTVMEKTEPRKPENAPQMLRVADHVVALASLLTTVVVDFPIEYTCLPLVSRAAVRLSSDLLAIQAWMGAHAVISEVNAAALFKTAVLLMANHLPRMVNQVVFDDFTPADDKKKGLTVSNVTLVKLLSDVNRFIFVTFNSAVATHFLRAIHTLLLSERWAGELDAIVPFIEKVTGELPRAMWLCCPMMVLSGVASFGPYVGAPIHFNKPGVGEREGYIVNLSAKYGQAVVAYRGENALEEETTVDLEDVCPTSFTSPQTTCIPTKCVRLIITATAERIFGATMKKTWNVFDLQAAVHTLYILRGMADSDPAALEYLLKKKTILLINRASSLLPVQSPVPFALLPVFVESAYRGYMERFVPVYKKFLNSTSPGAVPFTYEIPGEVNVFTKLRSAPTSSLCFDPSQNSACVVITPSSNDPFPVWKDGLYFEFSVFLRYLNAAGLAEASSSTSLWTAPSVQLDLLSVCLPPTKGKEDEPPLLKLSIVNDAVRCVLSARGNTVEVRADLFSSDLDTFTHMAVVLNEHHMTVMKSGEQNSTQFLPSVAKDVGNKLKTAGGISHLVIGNRGVSGVEVAECATERVMVKEFRMGTNTKHMQKAELIHRDGSLSSPSSADECYFQFNEGTGALCCSTNKKYSGALQGSVCWCPAPATVGSPVNLSDRTVLCAGEAPQVTHRTPIKSIAAYLEALSFPDLTMVLGHYTSSLVGHLSREVVRHALSKALSPSYLSNPLVSHAKLPTVKGEVLFVILSVFDPNNIAHQILNCFRYGESGLLSTDCSLLIGEIVKHALMFFEDPVRRKMKSIEIESVTEAFFQETVSSFLDGILSDKAEHFKVCAPVAAADPKNATSRPPVCPIAVYSSGASALSKLSGLESAVVFKDPDQKNVFAKFPDAQGGWTDAVFPSGLSWLYLSPVPPRGGEKNDPSLTVTAPSPFSLVYWSILLPIFRCFKEGPLGSYASQYFTARLLLYCINPPTGSSTSAKVNTPNPTLLAIASQMMDVWRCFPDVNVHDRAPLSEVLIHLNATLPKLPLLDRSATEDDPSADSKTAYGVGAQAAFAVLCSAVRLEEAWSGVSFPNRVRKSFHKVFSLWRHSVSSAPWQDTPDEEITPEQFFTGEVAVGFSESGRPDGALVHRKGNGEFYLCCENGVRTLRSNVGFVKGRIYFEVRIISSTFVVSVGALTRQSKLFHDTDGALGEDLESWAFDSERKAALHGDTKVESLLRPVWQVGDEVGICMDLELNRLTATVNGKPIYTFRKFRRSMDIEVFPAVTFGPSGCEVNFGAAPFKRALPPGYVTVDPCYLFSQSFTQLWGLVLFCQWAAHLEENESKNYVFDDATMSAFKMVTNKVLEFTRYRDGPLPVVLGQPLTDAARKDYETRCGRVSVVEGKWYYEVTVLNDDPDISVGWLTGDGNIGGANKEESTGAKGFSWVLETKRMIACGGAHQVSLGRHKWTAGDVIGCLLDCDEKKVSFTINGVLQKRLHDDEESALFQNIVIDPFGASPLVTRHVKSAVLHNFESSELLHCPEEFCPLGGTDVIHRAVVEYVLFGSQLMKDRNQLALERGSAVKILEYVAQNTDFNPSNQEIYSLSKVLQIHQARGREEESAVRGLAVGECVAHVAALSTLSCAAQSVLPFVHVEYTTKEVDPNMSARVYRAIQPAFFTVKAFCLPYVALELVRRHFMATTEESDLVKLTVNRRRALSTLSDPRATRAERIESSLFGQIYKLISDKPASMFRSGRKLWGITFLGEGADDVGGPYRESIAQICTELMSDKLPLFLPSANQQNNTGTNRDLFVVNPSLNSQQDLDLYRFLGRLIAGCLRRSELLSLSLSPVVWKDLVGERSTLDDLERVDSALVSSLRYLDESRRKGEVSAVLELFTSFTTTVEPAGEVELFPGGKNVPVSKNNLHVLLELTLDYHTRQVGAAQREALCRGFWEVIPLPVVSLLKWYELEEWVCGQKDYDPVVLLNHATYGGISSQSPRVLYLKDTLLQFTREERAKFMRFVSGRERLTPGMQLHIMPDADDDDDTLNKNTKLPHASTCFYQLVLPNYSSQAQMREKLLLAIEHCLDIDADFRIHDDTASFQQDNALTRVVIDDDEFEDYSHLQQ